MRSKSVFLFAATVLYSTVVLAQSNTDITLHTAKGDIYGTIELPALMKKKMPVVLIIAGSGPTDRDGNNKVMKNFSLKMLADSLQQHGIASVRYDKRGIAASKEAAPDEKDLRFDNYVDDAADWVRMLKKDKRFSKVIIAGHSEGSLIGMTAANREKADGFISIAGVGERADKVLRKQLSVQIQQANILDTCNMILDKLVAGEKVANTDKKLDMLFRPSVQDYLISWFRYDPSAEIAKLKVPVLILQGTTDIQVDTTEAHMLAAAAPGAKLVIIDGMNHIFKASSSDRQKNMEVYMNPKLPVMTELVAAITAFISGKK